MSLLGARKAIFLCYFFSFLLLGFVICTKKNFGNVTFDQILFVFILDPAGALQSDNKMTFRYLKWCLVLPAIFAIFLVYFKMICLSCANLLINMSRYFVNCRLEHVISVSVIPVFLLSVFYFFFAFDVKQVFISHFYSGQSDYFKDNYALLKTVPISKNNKPENVLLIYIESLENTYQRDDIFGENLLSALEPWQAKGISFEKSHQMPGTGWTLAGIIATQCGLPLKFYSNNQTEHLKSLLPNAVCLSDVLSQAGYYNVFMKGASLRFSGLGKFLKTHHFDEMYGREEWLQKGYSTKQMSGWGLPDEDLYNEATSALSHLLSRNQPFSLTMLTVDLHGPDGYISPACQHRGARDYAGLVQCQAAMLSNFLHNIEKKGWLKKMNVVILGDHLVMRNPLSDQLNQVPERNIYNLILPVKPITKVTNKIVHFSWFPTLLTLLNFDVPEGHAGLHYSAIRKNALSQDSAVKDLASQQSLDGMSDKLLLPSRTYQALWG